MPLPDRSPLLLAAASAPVAPVAETADAALARARSEAQQASRKLAALEGEAAKAGSEAARLQAEQAAAAAAIDEAEARINEFDARLRLARAQVSLAERQLASRRAPLAALVAGLATMGRQPPILTLADRGSVEEMVRVKALLDATMPVIERAQRGAAGGACPAPPPRRDADAARASACQRPRRARPAPRAIRRTRGQGASALLGCAGEAFGAGDRVLASEENWQAAGNEAAEQQAGPAGSNRSPGSGSLRHVQCVAIRRFRRWILPTACRSTHG